MDEANKLTHTHNKEKEEGIQKGEFLMFKGIHVISVPIETIAKASKLNIDGVEHMFAKIDLLCPLIGPLLLM